MTNTAQNIEAPRVPTLEERVAEMSRSVPSATNKAQGFNSLRRLAIAIEEYAPELANDAETTSDLARLWASFMPKTASKSKTAFDWCAKSIGNKDVRYYLNFVHVTEGKIEGTDGHGYHAAPNTHSIEPGYYGVEGVRLHGLDYARFPDTTRIRPDTEAPGREWHYLTVAELKTGSKATSDKKVLRWYELPCENGSVHIDAKLIDRLLSMDKEERVAFNVGRMADSVLAKLSGDRLAVIMPLRQ